jgi:serine/threonine protein kinase
MSAEPSAKYRLGRVLGRGGMAIVYEAQFRDGSAGGRRCVVKRILPEIARDDSFVKLFLAEARLSVLVRHPNIVRVFELGMMEGQPFLAMEYIEGHDLMEVARRCATLEQQIPIEVACRAIVQVAAALQYAHTLRDDEGRPLEIVHRDVSLSNIMLTAAGGVKLLDFGVAKAASHIRDEKTGTGKLIGKVGYMSPEQAEGDPVDRRSDIFSLGIVLHELLTMQRVFRGENDLQTLGRIREARPPAPSTMRSAIPVELDAIVLRMLARKREHRFQSCAEVARALAPWERAGDGERQLAFIASLRLRKTTPLQGPGRDDNVAHGEPVEIEEAVTERSPPPLMTISQVTPIWRVRPVPQLQPIPEVRPASQVKPIPEVRPASQVKPVPQLRPASRGVPTSPMMPVSPAVRGRVISFDRKVTTPTGRTAIVPHVPVPRQRDYRPLLATSVACAGAAAALLLFWLGEGTRTTTPPPAAILIERVEKPEAPAAAAPPESHSAPVLPTPRRVWLHIAGTRGAHVMQGHRLLGLVPCQLELPVQADRRELVIRKHGFRSATRVLPGDAYIELEIQLVRSPRSVKKQSDEPELVKDPFS